MSRCFLIFGFGYTAQILAPKLLSQGFTVVGTSRNIEKHQNNNLNLKLVDFNSPDLEKYISQSTHLLISIPPTNGVDDLVLVQYGESIKKQAAHLQWLGYLSSTGVYGDYQGDWVNEDTMCMPQTPSGIARLKAEKSWTLYAKENQLPLHIFRLSGIYGPGRNVLERLIKGKKFSIFKKEQVFCRIHVEDIASTLCASLKWPNPLSIYNVSDDEPAPAHVVDHYGAMLLHQKAPLLLPFSEASLSPMEREFYANNRRVSNAKIKKELDVTLKYPTYREGLTQIWRDNFAPK